jgi:hypothetical protein
MAMLPHYMNQDTHYYNHSALHKYENMCCLHINFIKTTSLLTMSLQHSYRLQMSIFAPLVKKGLFHAVAQLVEALCYKTAGRGFDSRWCQWNFSLGPMKNSTMALGSAAGVNAAGA